MTERIVPRISLLVFVAMVMPFALLQSQWRPSQQATVQPCGFAYSIEKAFAASESGPIQTSASRWFDVGYYRVALTVSTSPAYIQGSVLIAGTCRTENPTILTLDLSGSMHIDSIVMLGHARSFMRHAASFDVPLAQAYHAGDVLSLEVFYAGVPQRTGLGSFTFDSYNAVPWVYSLSEPYGAKDWWPCKDDPSDKADSADIIVTCDSTFLVGSEGVLVSTVNNGNGTATVHWKERYPIASYLISITLTQYVQFSNWFKYSDTDSMQILNYVLPDHETDARQQIPRVVNMLKIYSSLFGLYPFIKEKYGHSEFGRGGAMEHQTMTSTTTFAENVLAHELAHQWFGDMITCRTWADLWLNEGFAEYSTALYQEKQYGTSAYSAYMQPELDNAMMADGAIGIPDTSGAINLFNTPRIYSKGASVLHMLRHVLGDSVFFRTLSAYANDRRFQYGTASIADFQSVCESVSGKDLNYFFNEWIYGEKYPRYVLSWKWSAFGVQPGALIDIGQLAGSNPAFFTMPLDIRVSTGDRDTLVTIFNNAAQQQVFVPCTSAPGSVILDPNGWILHHTYLASEIPTFDVTLQQNYPNPFRAATTISYHLPVREHVVVNIYDLLGREVSRLVDAVQSLGFHNVVWTPHLASGVYFCRLTAGTARLQKKMLLLQ
jgi:aminopeptidase N